MFGLNSYLMGGVAAVALFAGVQTFRLDHAKADLTKSRAKLTEAAGALRAASEAIRGRDALILANAAHGASDAGELAALSKGSTRAAFDAGRASVRCAGAPSAGVRDLRGIWAEGAYNPAASRGLPGKPESSATAGAATP